MNVIALCLYVGESECTVLSSQYISEQDWQATECKFGNERRQVGANNMLQLLVLTCFSVFVKMRK